MSEQPKTPKVKLTITARVYRHYGAEAVEFGISREVEISSADDRHLQFAKLMTALYDEHQRYSAEFLPLVPPAAAAAADGGSASGKWVSADEVVVEIKDKKRYYYVKGGEYSKHGVAVYPEVLRTIGADQVMAENDSLKLTNKDMYVVQGVSGLKVSQFRKSPQIVE